MGFLSKIFAPFGGGTKPGFQAYYRTEYTSTQLEMLQMGYKENSDHEIFMPDTVWIGPRSKVYHSCDRCLGTSFGVSGGAIPTRKARQFAVGFTAAKGVSGVEAQSRHQAASLFRRRGRSLAARLF